MPQVRNLLRKLTFDELELPSPCSMGRATPSSGSGSTAPCTPCSPSAVGPFIGQKEAFVFQPAGHPKQAFIDGEVWPPIFKADFVRSAKKLAPLPSDVFVCTYPKCGTTWIQHICSQLMTAGYGPEVGKVAELCVTSPMIERMGGKFTENIKHPRLLKTHFNWRNCPKSAQAKYIFAVRNPKDCLASYFFHNRNFKIYDWADGDFNLFFELFCAGKLAFGDYFDHLLSWLPRIHDENVLFLKYEDMCEDLESAIVKIGKFIGGRAAELVECEETLSRIVDESVIDSMKQNQGRWFPGSVLREQTFIRKGGSGDWRNHLSREQSDRLDELFWRKLGGTVTANWWRDEMSWEEELPHRLQIILGDEEDEGIVAEADEVEEEEASTRRNTFSSSQSRPSLVPYWRLDRRGSLKISYPRTAIIPSNCSSGYVSRASTSGQGSLCTSRNSLASLSSAAHLDPQ